MGTYFQIDVQRQAELLTSQEMQKPSSVAKWSLTAFWMGLSRRLRRSLNLWWVLLSFVFKREAFVHCVHLHPSYVISCLTFFLAFIKTFHFLSSHQLHCCDFLAPIWSIRDRSQLETGQDTLVILLKYEHLECLWGVPWRLYLPLDRSGQQRNFPQNQISGDDRIIYLYL